MNENLLADHELFSSPEHRAFRESIHRFITTEMAPRAREFDAAVLGISGDLALGHLARILTIAGLRADGGNERLVSEIADSLPAIFLYHARGVQGINRRVKGITMDLRGELVTLTRWNVRGER